MPKEARRINREIFYRKLHQTWPEPGRESSARRRSLDGAEQARLAAAGSAARDLLVATGVEALAGPSNAQQTKLFTHQLAAAHRLMMRLSSRADAVVTDAADPLDRPEGLRLTHGAARLMERFRQGVAMLQRLRTGPDAPRRVENYWSGPISEYEREEERQDDISHGLDPDTGLPAEAALGAKAGLPADRVRRSPQGEGGSPSGSVLLRRGRLNNGNPGGDFLAAPRCGARTRAGCACRQPAMANGRCRFHGGKSTGPRTAAGRERARNNRLVHGLRPAELTALSAAAAAAHRRLVPARRHRDHKVHPVHRDQKRCPPAMPGPHLPGLWSCVVNPIPLPLNMGSIARNRTPPPEARPFSRSGARHPRGHAVATSYHAFVLDLRQRPTETVR